MKKLTVASIAVIALAAALKPAAAADYGPPPPIVYAPAPAIVYFSWTGFYFGAHAGGGFGHKTETGAPYPFLADTITPLPASFDVSGWLGGGQIGAQYQAGSVVFGAEADVSGANLTGSGSCASLSLLNGALPPGGCSAKVVGVGTIAGRLGYAMDRLLVYGKGGAAWANDQYSLTSPNVTFLPAFSGNETKWGWMVGVGVEYAFFENWSAKVEYDYLDLHTSNLQFADTTQSFILNTSIQQQLHLVKLGLNYRWGWAPVGIRY
jgi:opacity protein-like surface antigen